MVFVARAAAVPQRPSSAGGSASIVAQRRSESPCAGPGGRSSVFATGCPAVVHVHVMELCAGGRCPVAKMPEMTYLS